MDIKFSKKIPRMELKNMGKVSAMGIRPADFPNSPLPLLSLCRWLFEVALQRNKKGLFELKGRLLL